MEQIIVTYLYPALLTFLVSLLAWLVSLAATWIKDNVKNSYLNGVMNRLLEFANISVSGALNEMGPAIKQALMDGKITAEEKEELLAKGRQILRKLWGSVDRKKLEDLFGREELEALIDKAIDKALLDLESKLLPPAQK